MKKRSASDTRHADKRRDLARELIPQDARRAYLYPSKRGLPGTLLGMYRPILKNPRIILSTLLYALSAAFVVYALSQYANRQSDRNTIHRLARRVALLEAREKFGDPPVPPRPTPEPGGADEPHR